MANDQLRAAVMAAVAAAGGVVVVNGRTMIKTEVVRSVATLAIRNRPLSELFQRIAKQPLTLFSPDWKFAPYCLLDNARLLKKLGAS